ncbi:unnamed protein product [Rotaria socialis]|uniref:Uncharacterized protein n=1 Tax=Rotaria socialis TaxID=392032 RepID=A0A817VHR2_9BILA|nr:unnamed protein product [Rotaria socialis]
MFIISSAIDSIAYNQGSRTHLDKALHTALEAQQQSDSQSTGKEDQQQTNNKNQGLINTLVNHNNKIKNIENIYNFIVNNYANSSHVKEYIEKTKEIENHVFGAPRPHRSWREFLLSFISCCAIGGLLWKLWRKFVKPRFEKCVREINNGKQTSIPSISEHIFTGKGSDQTAMEELKLYLEKQLIENNIRHNELIQMFKGGNNNPVQAEAP